MGPEQIAVCIPIVALCIPIAAIVTTHLQKIAEIKSRAGGKLSADVRAELDAVKGQIEALRDTTSKFDLSFDAALTRLENRLDTVETRTVADTVAPSAVQIAGGYATASEIKGEAETTTRRVALRR